MNDAIQVEEGNGEGNVVADVHLHVVGQRLLRLLQKVSEVVVHQLHQQNGQACATPRYCTMLGCRISLRKRHSCSNLVRFLGLLGSTRMGCRSLAAQGSSSSVALHTCPYAPVPRVASRISRRVPKRNCS